MIFDQELSLFVIDTLLVSTGSSNTWVGADKSYVQTSSSQDTGHTVVCNAIIAFSSVIFLTRCMQSISYSIGSFSGEEYTDTVTLSSGLVIPDQSIGVASQSKGFEGIDGMLG